MSLSRPPIQASGPPQLPPQRPSGPTGTLSTIPPGMPPPHQVVRGSEVAGPPAGGDLSQMQYYGAPPPTSGPSKVSQPPPMGPPPPMNQPGMPPQNLSPVNPGPQTMMNLGFAPQPESHAPTFASQGPPMHASASEMSGPGQFSAPPPPSHSQMNAGMTGYNYTSQPRVMQPGQSAASAAGTQMSQPQPRKLDPDQMPSPVSLSNLI